MVMTIYRSIGQNQVLMGFDHTPEYYPLDDLQAGGKAVLNLGLTDTCESLEEKFQVHNLC